MQVAQNETELVYEYPRFDSNVILIPAERASSKLKKLGTARRTKGRPSPVCPLSKNVRLVAFGRITADTDAGREGSQRTSETLRPAISLTRRPQQHERRTSIRFIHVLRERIDLRLRSLSTVASSLRVSPDEFRKNSAPHSSPFAYHATMSREFRWVTAIARARA